MTTLKDKVAAWPGNMDKLLETCSGWYPTRGEKEKAALTILQRECIEELVEKCVRYNKAWAMKKAGLIHAKDLRELEHYSNQEFDAWQDVMTDIATVQELLTKTKA